MAMMSCAMAQDTLPGGFRPMTAFATYGVFTRMMANAVRMTLINNAVNPQAARSSSCWRRTMGRRRARMARRITGFSGCRCSPRIRASRSTNRWTPTKRWRCCSTRRAAAKPVVFSAVRPGAPVLKRGDGVPPAREAVNGAYVFRPFRDNGKPKLVLAICGGQVMANMLEILPDIEASPT